ncbi:MAG: hypothetical protein CXR30_08595 [Geobacter sp.]|nr:MAG: hypothetical protein CXR30_08595 [Geobacter sp.]
MHDIDRTLNEFGNTEMEMGEMGYEFGAAEIGLGAEIASPFNEMQEMELATELLSVSNEAELNQFLGSLIGKATSAARTFISSPTGHALGGILKQAAKKALPVVGGAIGRYFGGSAGADFGRTVASGAGRYFGLEQEGLNQEDQEFEAARQFVRFSGATVLKAAQAPAGVNPVAVARQAATVAAQRFMPGLNSAAQSQSVSCQCGSGARSGRWYRRGNKVILVGI